MPGIRPPAEIASLRSLLPPAMVQLHDLVGPDGLLALVEAYGGTRMFVPGRVAPDTPLGKLLSQEQLALLVDRWGGATLQIALCKTWRIHLLRAKGLGYDLVARRVGVAQKTVYREMRRDRSRAGSHVGQMDFRF